MSGLVDQRLFLLTVSKTEDSTVKKGWRGRLLTSALTLLQDGGVMGSGGRNPVLVDSSSVLPPSDRGCTH